MDFVIDAKFLYYILKANLPKRVEESLNGSAVPYIRVSCLSDMEVSFPEDIQEQQRIAKLLSSYDSMLATETNLIEITERERERATTKKITQLLTKIGG